MADSNHGQVDVGTILRMNDQLASVSSAQIPLSIDGNIDATAESLNQMSANAALQTSRGFSIEQAIQQQSTEYVATLRNFARFNGELTSLEILYQLGRNRELQLRTQRYNQGHLLTLILLGGLNYFLWLPAYTRLITTIYRTSNLDPGSALQLLEFLNENYYLSLAVYLFFVPIIFFSLRRRSFRQRRTLDFYTNQRNSILEFSLARIWTTYLDQNRINNSIVRIVDRANQSSLLHWADNQYVANSSSFSCTNFFRLIEQFQKARLDNENSQLRTKYSILGYILPGAGIVLFLSLLLFWPLIELLISICLP